MSRTSFGERLSSQRLSLKQSFIPSRGASRCRLPVCDSCYISVDTMVFAWDEHKNLINRRKHGISFETAVYVFADPDAMSYVERDVDGENRWHTIGLAGTSLLILLVAHTVKEKDEEEEIRIISARKATPRERDLYCPAQ